MESNSCGFSGYAGYVLPNQFLTKSLNLLLRKILRRNNILIDNKEQSMLLIHIQILNLNISLKIG